MSDDPRDSPKALGAALGLQTLELRPDVVAGKYDASLFDPTGQFLQVNEIFYSLQGEGVHSGRAALFVRLSKCNLKCKFCDTEFELAETVSTIHVVDRLHYLTVVHGVDTTQRPLVVLTGGEPALQNCKTLVDALHRARFEVAMETSGSVWSQWMEAVDHICVSPKVKKAAIPGQLRAHLKEVKWVVNGAFLRLYEKDPTDVYIPGGPNYLQPESNLPKWIAASVKLIQRHPWTYRMSLQTHKLMGLP